MKMQPSVTFLATYVLLLSTFVTDSLQQARKRDIVFLIDGTRGMGRSFYFVRIFISKIINDLNVESGEDQVAVVQYGFDSRLEFGLNVHSTRSMLLSAIKTLRYKMGGPLNTGAALDFVTRNVFIPAAGSRRDAGAAQILVLITAGRSSDNVGPAAEAVRQAGIELIAIGAKNAIMSELQQISSDPDSAFKLNEFRELQSIQQQLLSKFQAIAVIEEPTPPPEVTTVVETQRDIVFLIDESDYVGNSNLQFVRNFVSAIINSFEIGGDKVRVSLVLYSNVTETEFYLNTYSNRDELLSLLRSLSFKGGETVYTGKALDFVLKAHFIRSTGSRKEEGVPQFLVLITGGRSGDDIRRAADTLRQSGVITLAVGAGSADTTQLKQIAFKPNLVFKVSNFYSLPSIQTQVITLLQRLHVQTVPIDETTVPVEVPLVTTIKAVKRDIVFLIDGTPFMGRSFSQVREFLLRIIPELNIGPNEDRLALVLYGSVARAEFYLNSFSTGDEISNAIRKVIPKMGRPLKTGAALDFVTRNVFNPSAGSRRDAGAAQILVLITAGRSWSNIGPAAEAMRQAGIVPIVVGAKNAVTSELQQITSDPDSLFKLNTFQELSTIQQQLLSKVQPVLETDEPVIIVSEVVPKEMSERDVVFLIDGSDNVGDINLPDVQDFVIRIIQQLAVRHDKVRVGLAQYSDDTDAEFYLNTYFSKSELLSHVKSLRLRGGKIAKTGSALEFAIKNYFTSSAGSRIRENVPQFLLLITGGRSSDDVEEAADALKRAAVMTFAIGVNNADSAQLEEMAIDPSLVFSVNDFRSLPDVLNQLMTPLTTLSVPTVIIEEPTAKPEEEPLTTTEVLRKERNSNMRDIVFLVDGSPGMGKSFPHVREFLMEITQELDVGPDTDQVAVVQYSSDPKLEFDLSAHSTKDELLNAIKRLRFKRGRPLNTGAALDFVTRNVFIPAAGSRRDAGAAQFLVLIIAGKSSDNVGPAAEAIRQAGIVVVAIGGKQADTSELQQITSDPESAFILENFRQMSTISQQLLSKVQPVLVTEEPPLPTQEVVLKEMSKRDVVFLIDGSDNIGNVNLPHVRDFIIRIIQQLAIGRDKVRVGLAQYSDDTEAEFYLNTYSSKTELLSHVKSLSLRGGATANTGSALDFAIKYYFISSAGSRIRENVPQFLLLITGGRSSDDVEEAADALKRAAIMTFAIGVNNADLAQMEEMAIDPSLVFSVNDFHSLPDVLNQLMMPLTTLSVPTVIIEEPTIIEEPKPIEETTIIEEPTPIEEITIIEEPRQIKETTTIEEPRLIEEPIIKPKEEPLITAEAKRRDIVFLIDGSPGMGRSFPQVREFLLKLIQEFDIGPDADQVAVVQYSSTPRLEFALNVHSTSQEALNAVQKLKLKTGKPLNTGAALDFIINSVFIPAAGSRRDAGAEQVLVLIIAGRSSDNVGPAAEAVRQAGIVPIAIGANHANTLELQQITSDPDSVLILQEFKELPSVQEQVLSKVGAVFVVEESIPPIEVAPQDLDRRDIVFLIDGSARNGNVNFFYIRELIRKIIGDLDIGRDRVQVGVAQYSDSVKTESYLNSFSTKTELMNHVKGLKLKGGRTVNTGAALDHVHVNLFTKSAGSRKEEGVPQILVLFTGVRSMDDVGSAADALRNAAVITFGVGIRKADALQLKEIANDPSMVLEVKELSSMPDVQTKMLKLLSTVPTSQPPTEKPIITIKQVLPKVVGKKDIVFLVDASDNVRNTDFLHLRDFLTWMIDHLDIGSDGVQIGLVQYSNYAETEFYLNTYSSEVEILSHMEGIRQRGGMPLNTGAALDYVLRNHFTRSSGSKKDEGVPQILVLLMAGRSRDYVTQSADALKRAAVTVFAVGTRDVDPAQVKEISSEARLGFSVEDFRSLPNLQEQVMISLSTLPATREPTHQPTVPVKAGGRIIKKDIVFLIDASDNVRGTDFGFVHEFLRQIIENIDIGNGDIQIGLVQYSNYAETEFYLNTYSSEDEILSHMEGIRQRGGMPLNTGAALDYVLRNHFTRSSGSRKDEGVPQILVLLMAGRSRDYVTQSADALKRAAVTVFAVGTRDVDPAQVKEISSEARLGFSVEDFRSLPDVQEQVMISLSTLPATREPTHQPTVPVKAAVLGSGSKRDIVFLVDGSDQVGKTNVPMVRTFLTSLIENLDIGNNDVQIGLVQYSNYPETEFYLNTYSSEDEIMQHVEELQLRGGKILNTGAALDYVLQNHFIRSSGSRKADGVPQLLVLLTAGRSRDNVKPSADALKQAAVGIFAVGTKNANSAQLKEMATNPSLVFRVQEFHSLPHVQEQMMIPLTTLTVSRVSTENPTLPSKQVFPDDEVKRDIVFLIDGSDNIGKTDFPLICDFLINIIQNLNIGSDRIRVGLVQYSTYAETEFYLNTYLSKAEILSHVRGLRLKGGTKLNTGAALDYVFRYHFISSAGSRRRNGIPQFLVVLTGGRSRDNVEPPADALKRAAIMTFAIGVKNADLMQLGNIAIDPSLVFSSNTLYSLPSIEEDVTTLLTTLPAPHPMPEEPTAPIEPVAPPDASKRDIVFLIDGSSNIGNRSIMYVRDFLTSIIENLDIGRNRIQVGLVQYSNFAETEFYLNTYSSEDELLSHVKGLNLRGGTSLKTGAAIDYVLRYHFTQSAGSRKEEGVPQILVLITGGRSGGYARQLESALKRAAVLTFAIAVKDSDPLQLQEMSIDPGLIFRVQEFSSLPDVQEQLMLSLSTLTAPTVVHKLPAVITEGPIDTVTEGPSTTDSKRDIIFLIDESDYVGNSNLRPIRDFISTIIENLDIGSDRVRVGLVLYSDTEETEFYLNTYLRKDEILDFLKTLRFKGGRRLATGKALDFVLSSHFIRSVGSRREEGIPQFLVLITGGRSGDDIRRAADTLKQSAIVTLAVGSGSADPAQLKQLAFNPNLAFHVRDFYSLPDIQQQVMMSLQRPHTLEIITEEPTVHVEERVVDRIEVSAATKRDIVFLIDTSPGMGGSFRQVHEFLMKLIQELDVGPDKDQVAVIQYNSKPTLEFGLGSHSTAAQLLYAVKRLRPKKGRPLNTGAALDFVTRNVFIPAAGSRRDAGAAQILVLIAAGRSSDNVGPAAEAMKQAGIELIAIGAKHADASELQQITSDPESVFILNQFQELPTIQQQLLSKAQPVPVTEETIIISEVEPIEMSKRDVVFLIDGSDNIGNANLPHVRDFIIRIIQQLAIGHHKVRVGLAQYSDDTEAEFYLNTYSSKTELLSHVKGLSLRGGATANTGSALDFAIKYYFISSAGSRIRENVPQFLLLITGGRSSDDVEEAADALKRAAVMTFAIGVNNADPAQLEEMAIDPSLVFSVNDFRSLPDVLNQLMMPLTMLSVPTVIEESTVVEEEMVTTSEARKRDIVFLIDGSRGMGKSFQKVREFLKKVIQELNIGPDTDRVAVVQYSSNARIDFGLNVYSTKDEALNAVRKLKLKTGRPLNTGAALDFVTNNVFIPPVGSRRDAGAIQILVLITAGKSSDNIVPAVEAMRQAGIVPIAIGANSADKSELQQIVHEPSLVLKLSDFQELPTIENELISKVKTVIIEDATAVNTEVLPDEVNKRDIIFLIDGSDNVGSANLFLVHEFISGIIENLDIGSAKVRVGLAQFSHNTKTEFYLNTYSTKAEILSHVKGLRLKGGSILNIGAALDFVLMNLFTENAGSRKEQGVPQFLVVFTGGRSSDVIKPYADALKQAAISTFAVGAKNASPAQLNEIATYPSLVFSIKEFQNLPDVHEWVMTPLSTMSSPTLTVSESTIINEEALIEEEVEITGAEAMRQDIVFLIDGTIEMGKAFPVIRQFLIRVIKELDIGPDKDQVAVVQYSSNAKTEFAFNTYSSKDEVLGATTQIRRKTGRVLNTGAALEYVSRNIFTTSAGSRQGAQQILVLITAGRSMDDINPAVDRIKQAHIVPIAIGAKNVDPTELRRIANSPDFLIMLKTFHNISTFKQRLITMLKSVSV